MTGLRPIGLGLIGLALAACGGASVGGGANNNTTPIEAYGGRYDAFVDVGTISDSLDPTPQETLAASGSATYEGDLFLGSRATVVVDAVVGDLSLTFDLSDSTFFGEATNFVGRDSVLNNQQPVRQGALTIADGFLVRSNNQVSVFADVTGSLEFNNGTREITGGLVGTFKGENAEYVGGRINVGYDVDPIELSPTLTLDRYRLEGGFVAAPR